MARNVLLSISVCMFYILFPECYAKINVELVRYTSPFEQHLNSPNLEDYGVNFDWITKKRKHHGTQTNDSIALYRYLDNEFYGKIIIGHPGQTLNVAFDTAWIETWVMSEECTSVKNPGCWFHNTYDHTKSSYYKPDGRPFIVNEGKYNLTGYFSYENISIAHSNVTNQSFVEMVGVPNSFIFNKIDGILGLGRQVGEYEPFFYKLLRQKKIKNPLFSIYLNRDRQSNRGGNIMLGFYDKNHVHQTRQPDGTIAYDDITYVPVIGGQYWEFKMNKVVLDSNQVLCENECNAISDTSSNTIIGPAKAVTQIHKLIKAKEFFLDRYTVNCETINKLPNIDFIISGKNFTLKGTDYVMKMAYRGVTLCVSSFVPTDVKSEEGFWVLGGAFLSSYYTIYNVQEKIIGIVKAA